MIESSPLTLSKTFTAIITTVLIATSLSESYQSLSLILGESWLSAAALHSFIALAVLIREWWLDPKLELLSWRTVKANAPEFLNRVPSRMFIPALVVIAGAVAMVFASRQFGVPTIRDGLGTHLMWILWVPMVEELVFRVGIGRWLRSWLGIFWGAWFGSVLFSLVHAAPTFSNLMAGQIGLPFGPFLLGLCCELLYMVSGRVWSIVALHAACNTTVVIFALGDDRWLQWLDFLYG